MVPKTCSEKKKNFYQNCKGRSKFSVFEATSWASYSPHISNYDKLYPKLAQKKNFDQKSKKKYLPLKPPI